MSTHTPGPWTFSTVRTSVGICHKIGDFPTGLDHKPISYACVYEDGMSKQVEWDRGRLDSELFANARLIAAAPDLLAALKALMQDSRFNLVIGGNPNAVDALVKQVDEAIAKAEGKGQAA